MNLKAKFDELLQLLDKYLAGQVSNRELQLFSWEVIDYFTEKPSKELPGDESFERSFWYAIWQIQHLCNKSHQDDGTAKRELAEVIAFMKGEKEMPEYCIGRRP